MDQGEAAVVAAVIAGIAALASAIVAFKASRESARLSSETARLSSEVERLSSDARLKREFQLEFAAERVAEQLFTDPQWRLRTFKTLKHHLGGFAEDELRKILVRAGAIRFISKDGEELWGLLRLNIDRLGVESVNFEDDSRIVEVDGRYEFSLPEAAPL